MSEHYHVRVAGDRLVFSAGHFITVDGNFCERLHGHDYRVAAEVHGPLDANGYVVDFVALRERVAAILDELDHRMLLPSGHPSIRVQQGHQEVEVTFGQRRWVFPREDCALLPVANTTTELLCRHVATRLLQALEARTGNRPKVVRIEIAEHAGQTAACELRDP